MSDKTINLTIDSRAYAVPAGSTLLEACRLAGIDIPTLCHLPEVSSNASCGLCVVEVQGAKSLVRSCVQKAAEGMVVKTNGRRVETARRTALELLLANHPDDCLSCSRNGSCELQAMAERFSLRGRRFPRTRPRGTVDETSPALVRDNDKCILCGRCVAVCREVQTVSAIDFAGRSQRTHIATFMDGAMSGSVCVSCGQCTLVCPTGALTERDQGRQTFDLIADPAMTVVVQTAPAIRASLGEALGMPSGSLVTGKMVAALRRLGFAKVFDTQFSADLTIMEEGHELLHRLKTGGALPMITSCSPGWISFIETFYPSLVAHVSSCKSPQQMFGAVAKTYWADKAGVDPSKMRVVSIMPCTAKKFEAGRPEFSGAASWWAQKRSPNQPGENHGSGLYADVDIALTTRELARMIRYAGIDFDVLPEEDFDDPLGESTGAATIFANTGGVMEAAVRTVYEVVTGKAMPNLELTPVRGMDGIKTAELSLDGTAVRVAVAHTLKNARTILEEIAAGTSPYHFVEIMTCPGGCVGGGGQPLLPSAEKLRQRQEAIYREDQRLPIRKSHENPAILALYKNFLGEPLGKTSHALLHTHYKKRVV